MIDQTVQIKYIGTEQRWPELSITGRQSVWMPGQIESRSRVEAASLLATGLFSSPPVPVTAVTSPGGGIALSVGGVSAELPEVAAAQSAATLASATAALTPILTDEREYIQGYYVKVGGTRTTGRSTPGDWSDANCYGAIQTALNQGWTSDDAVVLDDGEWSMTVFSVVATTALTGALLKFRSRSMDPTRSTLVFTDTAQSGFRLNRSDRIYSYHIAGFTVKRGQAHTGTHAAYMAITTPCGDVLFSDVIFADAEISHPASAGIRGYFGIGHNTSSAKTVTFRRVKFSNLRWTGTGGKWFATSEIAGDEVVLDDCEFADISATATGQAVGFSGGFVGMDLDLHDVRVNALTMTHMSTAAQAHYPLFAPGDQKTLTIDGLELRNVTMQGGACGAYGFRAEGAYTINRVRGYDCSSLPAQGVNSVGGLCLAYGPNATGTIQDVIAERCVADFGTLMYWSQGGSGTAKAMVAANCSARVGGIVYSGGWGDCTADGVVGIDCQYGDNPYANPVSPESGFLHGHNHPTLATRNKSITFRNVRTVNCRNVSVGGYHTLYMHSINATYSLTAVVDNVISDGAAENQIGLMQNAGATFSLSGSVAVPGGSTAIEVDGTITGGLNVTGNVQTFPRVPTLDEAIAWARHAAGI